MITEERRDARTRLRAADERLAQVEAVRAERRDQFELQVLRDLYGALNRLGRLTARYHLADANAARATGRAYGTHVVEGTDELSEELRLVGVEVRELSALVLNDSIRVAAENAQAALAQQGMFRGSVEDADRNFAGVIEVMAAVQQTIGERIRELYKGES